MELAQMFKQMMENKEHGSIAKTWRQRYMDARAANAQQADLDKIVKAMEADAVATIDMHSKVVSPQLVFKDHSGLRFEHVDDHILNFVAVNYVSIDGLGNMKDAA